MEHVTFRYGQKFPPAALTLCSAVFSCSRPLSTSCLRRSGGEHAELVVLAALHLVFINRVRLARAFAASQRAEDWSGFRAPK